MGGEGRVIGDGMTSGELMRLLCSQLGFELIGPLLPCGGFFAVCRCCG